MPHSGTPISPLARPVSFSVVLGLSHPQKVSHLLYKQPGQQVGLSGSQACSPFLDQRKLPFALPNMALRETIVLFWGIKYGLEIIG